MMASLEREESYLDELRKVLTSILQTKQANLSKTIQHCSLTRFTEVLFTAKLITPDMKSEPSCEKYITYFISNIRWQNSKDKLEAHCSKFLMALKEMGIDDAAQDIEQSWLKDAQVQLNLKLNFRKPQQVNQSPQNTPIYPPIHHTYSRPLVNSAMSHNVRKQYYRNPQIQQRIMENQQSGMPGGSFAYFAASQEYSLPPPPRQHRLSENDDYMCSLVSQSTDDSNSSHRGDYFIAGRTHFDSDMLVTPNGTLPKECYTDPSVVAPWDSSGRVSDINFHSEQVIGEDVQLSPNQPAYSKPQLPSETHQTAKTPVDSEKNSFTNSPSSEPKETSRSQRPNDLPVDMTKPQDHSISANSGPSSHQLDLESVDENEKSEEMVRPIRTQPPGRLDVPADKCTNACCGHLQKISVLEALLQEAREEKKQMLQEWKEERRQWYLDVLRETKSK